MTNHFNNPILRGGLDFPWCLSFLQKRGRELYGPNFEIHSKDHGLIYSLLVYFLGDRNRAAEIGIDLHKGILLTGPIGCGKTAIMNLMRFVPPPERNHTIKPCRDIGFEFIREGYDVINRYSRMSFTNSRPKIYCFDDMGTERSLKYYGNECNVMGEVVLNRYDLFISTRMITHVITNLSASEMEDCYGSRVRSRMRELFNLISFSKETSDKRK